MNNLDEKLRFDIELGRINKLYTEYVNEHNKKFNVTRSEMSFLIRLYAKDNIPQETLSKSQKINDATVTRALVRLENKGYIERIPNKNDKRKKMVLLTEKGREITDKVLEHNEIFKKEIFSSFSPEEKETLLKLLDKLLGNLLNYK